MNEPPQSLQGKARKNWARRLILAICGLIAGMFIAELTLRLMGFNPSFEPVSGENYRISPDPELKYDLVPGSEYLGTPINAAGMRDRPRHFAKPPGVFRIACIGDSVTFGLYVKMDEAFPSQLEALPNERQSTEETFEVLNFGVTGYNITQAAATLRKRVLDYSPDLILYGYCLNDPSDYSLEYALLRQNIDPRKRRYLDGVVHQTNKLASHSHLYRLIYYAWSAESYNWGYGTDSALGQRRGLTGIPGGWYLQQHEPGPGWERVTAGMADIAAAVEDQNIPVIVAIFPLLDQLDDYPCAQVHERVRAAAEQNGFFVLDLLRPFKEAAASSTVPLRKDELHPTPAGHRIVAEAILEEMEKAGLLPGHPSTDVEKPP